MTPPIKLEFSSQEIYIKKPKEAENVVGDLTKKERQLLLDALNKNMWTKATKKEFKELGPDTKKSKEQKEKMKMPQLESENYRIDVWLSKKEKLAQWWKAEERPALVNWIETKIKVLKKELSKGAYVREYQDDGIIPNHLVGEQLFNWEAVLYLKLQDRLPLYSEYEKMWFEWKDYKKAIERNFTKWDNVMYSGDLKLYDKKFHHIGERMSCRLEDGSHVVLTEDYMFHTDILLVYGLSLRLLKK